MRISPRLLIVPASLLLLAPAGAAHAAKANPWSAYYPAKGVTCTSTAPQADGTAQTVTETVLKKTASTIVTRVTGEGRTTSHLLSGGRLTQKVSVTERDSGMKFHMAGSVTYPSPAKLLHHGHGAGSFTMTMTMPAQEAKVLLTHGRTLTMTVKIRVKGLGARTITLADPAATPVQALGIRTQLGAVKISNAKPAFKHEFTKLGKSSFAALDDTQWVAKGRDVVEDDTRIAGTAVTLKQVSCS